MRAWRLKDAQEWLKVAERCMRVQKLFDAMIADKDKRDTARTKRLHRLPLIERRAHFGR